MESLFASGRIIDPILILVLLEAVLLWLWHRVTGTGPEPKAVLPFLAAGFMLLLALRAALAQAPWPLVALPLSASLFAHLADLIQRWPNANQGSDPQRRA